MVLELLINVCNVSLPYRESLTSWFYFKVVPIKIIGCELPVDLIVLKMVDYNVILGMDWLSKHNSTIFCRKKKVVFQPSKGEMFEYKGIPRGSKRPMVSAMKAYKMLAKGCIGSLASIVETTKKVKIELPEAHIVCKFLNVFLEDLLGLPPDWKIKFEIELLPGVEPISKGPYRMTPMELKELK